MTYEQWASSRQWTDNLAHTTGMDHETYPCGFVYAGGEHIEARGWGYGVVIGCAEREFTALEDAERYLWDEWAESENN